MPSRSSDSLQDTQLEDEDPEFTKELEVLLDNMEVSQDSQAQLGLTISPL